MQVYGQCEDFTVLIPLRIRSISTCVLARRKRAYCYKVLIPLRIRSISTENFELSNLAAYEVLIHLRIRSISTKEQIKVIARRESSCLNPFENQVYFYEKISVTM